MTRDLLTHEPVEDERYELLAGPCYDFAHNRREFVGVLGAGLLIAVAAPNAIAQQAGRRSGGNDRGGQSSKVADRVHIGVDGTVTVLTGKVEVGQGARTQVCQAAAEELRMHPANIHVIMGDTELCPNDGGTSGSGTTPRTIPSIRAAAAVARQVLLDLAATRLQVDASSLSMQDGRVVDLKSNRSVSYAELAKDETLKAKLDRGAGSDVSIAPAERWQVLGTSPGKAGAEQIVTGSHRYPSDIVRPDMLYGRILRRPTYGARLTSIDLKPAEAMPGVTVVRDGEFVGCAARSSWLAAKAIEALAPTAQWEQPEASQQATSDTLFKYLKDHAAPQQAGGGRGFGRGGGTSRGSIEQGLAEAKKTLNANYEIAYIQHAPMEPRAAVAQWQDGKLTVWTGTQNPMRVRGELMQAFRLPTESVRVIVPDAGGGFGGKHTGEVALEAARLAKGCGQPVSVRWTREEEFVWAYFRPAGLIEVRGGLDPKGRLLAWAFANYNSGGSALETPYNIPHVRTQFISCDAPLRAGSYRALASTANTFARECFMDELAEAAEADPLSFRLDHLAAGRLRDVLVAATEKFDWSGRRKKHGSGRGVGLACGTEKGSFVAACAEVEVDRHTGIVKVHHVCQAFECGAIQNPENLRAQVEGCVIMGLGGALRERIDFADGKIRNASFSEYLVPRMDDVPSIDTVLVNRRDLPSTGAGETPIIAVAPAIANAVFHATGIRVRAMPIPTKLLKQDTRAT